MNGSGRLQLGSGQAPAHNYSGDTTLNAGVTWSRTTTWAPATSPSTAVSSRHYWASNFIRGLGAGAGQVQITGGASGFS